MMSTTQTMTMHKSNTIRDFFDKHKIPYCLVRHEFYEEDGIKKKRLDKKTLPNDGWEKYSYETMMGINDYNQRAGDTTIMACLTNSRFGVFDCDNYNGMDYINDNYGIDDNFTASICRDMPHIYFLKDKDDPGISCTGWQPGLDLCYGMIFEKLDGEIIKYNESTMHVFRDYPKPKPVITPASVMRLDNKERTFDPTILDIIDSKYFGKENYSHWFRIMWGIIYCWGRDEGRDLCIKYSSHPDYTEQQTVDGVDNIIKHHNTNKSNRFGTLCYYAKETNKELYDTWQRKYQAELPKNFRDLALRCLKSELNNKLVLCEDEIYYKEHEDDINFIHGEKQVKRQLFSQICNNPDKYKYVRVNELKGTEDVRELVSVKETEDVIKFILMNIRHDDDFITNMIEDNKNKIWFKDGYWNVKKNKFYFRTIESTCIFINREIYSKSNPETRQDIREKILLKLFNNRDDLVDYYLYILKMALSCNISIKQFYEITGKRDCGKSILIKMQQFCFGDYVANLSINNFYKKKGDSETRDLGFLLQFPHARIFILNENDPSKELNGSIIKSLCSGGDVVKVRALHKEETLIVPQGTLYMYANNSLKIEPLDTNEKKVSFLLNNKFVEQSFLNDDTKKKHSNVNYYLRDDTIDDYVRKRAIVDEFTLMVLEAKKCSYPEDLLEDELDFTEDIDTILLNDFAYSKGSMMSHYKIVKYIKEKELALQPKELRHLIKGLFTGLDEINKNRRFTLINIIRVDDEEVEEVQQQ